MADYPIIFDPAAMRSLLAGRKSQARLLASSPLRQCQPGDRLWVKESFAGGKTPFGQTHEIFAPVRSAEFVVFMDGWRQHRDGRGRAGPIPTSASLDWSPAIHLPRWASRRTLVVDRVRVEPLHQIDQAGVVAEGLVRPWGGLLWRWDQPGRGVWRDPGRAFATCWDRVHGTAGERWADNPDVVTLCFSLVS
jgi:hypothetical protein